MQSNERCQFCNAQMKANRDWKEQELLKELPQNELSVFGCIQEAYAQLMKVKS
jgi:hypothetical protein